MHIKNVKCPVGPVLERRKITLLEGKFWSIKCGGVETTEVFPCGHIE
jgi:hypothetical protein